MVSYAFDQIQNKHEIKGMESTFSLPSEKVDIVTQVLKGRKWQIRPFNTRLAICYFSFRIVPYEHGASCF